MKYAVDHYSELTSLYPFDESAIPQAAKAFVTWESLPEKHPCRQENSLQDIMQSAETQQSFIKEVTKIQEKFQEETAVPFHKLPDDVGRLLGSYLTLQDAGNLAPTNKAHGTAASNFRTKIAAERAAATATPPTHG